MKKTHIANEGSYSGEVTMVGIHEERVRKLARRLGLELSLSASRASARLYQLIEPNTMAYVFPGDSVDGAALMELEDWLGLPWE